MSVNSLPLVMTPLELIALNKVDALLYRPGINRLFASPLEHLEGHGSNHHAYCKDDP